jgi:hypothetical protein
MASEELKDKDIQVEHDTGSQKDDLMIIKISDAERKRVLRKIDIHLLPFVSALYLLSFL